MSSETTPGTLASWPTKEEQVKHFDEEIEEVTLTLVDIHPTTLSNAIVVTATNLDKSVGRIIHPSDDFEPFYITLSRAVAFAYKLQKDIWLIKELHPRAQEKQREELEKHITQPGHG